MKVNIENIIKYGHGLSVIELNKENINSYFQQGLLSTDYQGKKAKYPFSHDCVCFTIIPNGKTGHDRLAIIDKKYWNMYYTQMLTQELPERLEKGTTLAAVIVDFKKVAQCKNVRTIKAYGRLPSLYFLEFIEGIDRVSFEQCLCGHHNILDAEVRTYLKDPVVEPPDPQLTGVTQEAWKALLIRPSEATEVINWVNLLDRNLIQKNLPIYDTNLKYVVTLEPNGL